MPSRDEEIAQLRAQLEGERLKNRKLEERMMHQQDALSSSPVAELLNTIERVTSIGGWEYDVASQSMFWTQGLIRLHDLDPEAGFEHIGDSINCYQPQDQEVVMAAFQRCVRTGESYDLTVPFTTYKRRKLWVRTMTHAIWEGGTVAKVVGAVIDVTREIETRTQLERSERYFKQVINFAPVGIAESVIGQLSLVNEEFLNIFALSQAQAQGTRVDTLFVGASHNDLELALARLGQSRQAMVDFECQTRRADHQPLWLRVHVSALGQAKSGHLLWAFMDITTSRDYQELLLESENDLKQQNAEYEALNEELRQTNEELYQAKERSEESDKLKTAFLSNISHEIRTPLNGIVGFAEMLRSRVLPEEKRSLYLQIILDSSNQLARVVSDVLDISKIETRQIRPVARPFDLHALLEDLTDTFSAKAQQKQLQFDWAFGSDSQELEVVADEEVIEKVLTHLLDNALKFTSRGRVFLRYWLGPGKLHFEVSDTGIGIAPENQRRVFDRFVQVEASHTRSYGGTGLGLSICKGLLEVAGGSIRLESELGKGSMFRVELPFRLPGEPIRPEPVSSAEKSLKIIVAEDQPMNFVLIEEIFSEEILCLTQLFHAQDGNEAISFCEAVPPPDLVIMDLQMPRMDGLESTRRIKARWPDLPVMVLTSYATPDNERMAQEAGCDAFVTKPIKISEFKRVLAELLPLPN